MSQILAFLNSIRLDKYLHMLVSVAIFAAVHYHFGTAYAAYAAMLAHAVKKGYDVGNGSRDWADVWGDMLAGAIGVVMAWACTLHG